MPLSSQIPLYTVTMAGNCIFSQVTCLSPPIHQMSNEQPDPSPPAKASHPLPSSAMRSSLAAEHARGTGAQICIRHREGWPSSQHSQLALPALKQPLWKQPLRMGEMHFLLTSRSLLSGETCEPQAVDQGELSAMLCSGFFFAPFCKEVP